MTRTLALLINPTSGSGKGAKNAPIAARRLRERGCDVLELTGSSADDSLALAVEAVNSGVDGLVAVGGDGTVNLALQAVVGTQTPLGIIPVGTGDDNARGLGIELKDVQGAADIVADGRTRTIDVGQVQADDGSARYFMGIMSAGFDSEVNERANGMRWPGGQLKYLIALVAELSVFKAIPYTLTIDDEKVVKNGMLVAIGNGVSYGGGMKVCPDSVLDDGLLDATFLDEVSKFTFLRAFPSVFKGTHIKHPYVYQYRGKQFTLDGPDQIVYADGERVGPLPATASIVPSAIQVFVPTT